VACDRVILTCFNAGPFWLPLRDNDPKGFESAMDIRLLIGGRPLQIKHRTYDEPGRSHGPEAFMVYLWSMFGRP
jgi:hypothetical protein